MTPLEDGIKVKIDEIQLELLKEKKVIFLEKHIQKYTRILH